MACFSELRSFSFCQACRTRRAICPFIGHCFCQPWRSFRQGHSRVGQYLLSVHRSAVSLLERRYFGGRLRTTDVFFAASTDCNEGRNSSRKDLKTCLVRYGRQSSRHSRTRIPSTAQVFPGRSAADMPFHSTLFLPALEVFSAGVQPRRAVYILRSIAVRNVVSKAEIPAAGATIEE